jgi:predicted HTH transcriptional regulator
MAKQFDLEKVLAIVRAGKFEELIGVVEGDKLECKGSSYRLDDEHERFELAKDVTSFANAHGGVILLGVQTVNPLISLERSEHSRSLM